MKGTDGLRLLMHALPSNEVIKCRRAKTKYNVHCSRCLKVFEMFQKPIDGSEKYFVQYILCKINVNIFASILWK